MDRLSALLAAVFLSTAAAAETWSITEGICGDWAGSWNVTENQDNIWLGAINERHEGGKCESANGELLTGNIRATIIGENFTAHQLGMSNGYDCTYTGSVSGNRIAGVYTCPQINRSFNFSISR